MRTHFSRIAGIFALLALAITSLPIAAIQSGSAQAASDVTAAAQQAVGANLGVDPGAIVIDIVAQSGDWVYGTGVLPGGADDGNPQTRFFLAYRTATDWRVALRYTPEFTVLLRAAPEGFPTPEIRAILDGGFNAAGDGAAQLSFPFPVNQTWGFGGPHPAQGSNIRDALDFYLFFQNTSNLPVLAMRGGVVFRPCANMILIDHGDGWTTGYYHVTSINVQNGQTVQRGAQIGGTSDQIGCGGWASGPHVHVWLEYQGHSVPIDGHDIGGWTVEAGANAYDGCMVKDGVRRCTGDGTNWVVNEGIIGSGLPIPTVELQTYSGQVGDNVPVILTGFPANSSVSATWKRPGGSTVALTPLTTDATGSANGSLVVPATNTGSANTIQFTSGSASVTVNFSIDPSIRVTPVSVDPGGSISVAFDGFPKKEIVTITHIHQQTGARLTLGTILASNVGSGSASFTIPANAPVGAGSIEANSTGAGAVEAPLTVTGSTPTPTPPSGNPAVALSTYRTTVGISVAYTVTGYPASSPVQLTWVRVSGGTIDLGTTMTDASGSVSGAFTVPAATGGLQAIQFSATGAFVELPFEIAPRIKVTPASVSRGSFVDVSLRGFDKKEPVDIRWKQGNGWVVVASILTSNTGSANVQVQVPAWVPNGDTSVRADGPVFRAQTNAVTVSGGTFHPAAEESPTPSPTATATATETATVTETPVSDADASPTVTVDETGTPVSDVDASPTVTVDETGTPEPEPTVAPAETPADPVGEAPGETPNPGGASEETAVS